MFISLQFVCAIADIVTFDIAAAKIQQNITIHNICCIYYVIYTASK